MFPSRCPEVLAGRPDPTRSFSQSWDEILDDLGVISGVTQKRPG